MRTLIEIEQVIVKALFTEEMVADGFGGTAEVLPAELAVKGELRGEDLARHQ